MQTIYHFNQVINVFNNFKINKLIFTNIKYIYYIQCIIKNIILVLKKSLCELLGDCGELNKMLKSLILILHESPSSDILPKVPLKPELLNQISSIDNMVSRKQLEIDALISGLSKQKTNI